MKEVRIGIIGMGIGRPNARAFHRHAKGRVTALCDLDEARMQDFAKELGGDIEFFTDHHKMCASKNVDAVFVGTPNQLHCPMAIDAMKAGKHVLVTKPLGDSLKAAKKAVEVAESAGVVNMMSLSTRFADNVQYLGRHAAAGDYGELYYARARSIRRSGIPGWNTGFIKAGGGAFRDMGVHVLDSCWWVMGMPEPETVTGVAGAKFGPRGLGFWSYNRPEKSFYKQYNSDDYAGGFIRFANGAGLQCESFWASHQPEELQIEVFGTEAGAKLHPLTVYRTVDDAPHDTEVKLPKRGEPWDNIASHFIECVLDGKPCAAPLRHGMLVQAMLEAMLSSAEKGKEVAVKV